MSYLVRSNFKERLTAKTLKVAKDRIVKALKGRIDAAYFFGSCARGDYTQTSDIDLIIINSKASDIFVKRAFEFEGLLDIYSDMNILVYTPAEFSNLTTNPSPGFWSSVKSSMQQIV